jgi:hypothetical protein
MSAEPMQTRARRWKINPPSTLRPLDTHYLVLTRVVSSCCCWPPALRLGPTCLSFRRPNAVPEVTDEVTESWDGKLGRGGWGSTRTSCRRSFPAETAALHRTKYWAATGGIPATPAVARATARFLCRPADVVQTPAPCSTHVWSPHSREKKQSRPRSPRRGSALF